MGILLQIVNLQKRYNMSKFGKYKEQIDVILIAEGREDLISE